MQHNHQSFINCNDSELWRLLSKSMRNIPYLARYIDDSYSFKTGSSMHINHQIISLVQNIAPNTEPLFSIWYNCNEKVIAKDKLKNANHRLFDTLITLIAIEQRYFMQFGANVKDISTDDIIKLLVLTRKYLRISCLSDAQLLCKTFTTKGYNIAAQIYNTHNYYQDVLNITEIIESSCLEFGDTELAEKCYKIYESAIFKCDNMQTVYYKLAKNIANIIQQNGDISKSYKYLKLLVKYQTHSKNKDKFNNTSSISLVDMLRNVGVDFDKSDENIIIQLLSEQLRLYQSSFSYNTTIQQIEILETLLKHYFLNQRPIQRALALIDLAKLIRISKPNESEKTSTPRKKRASGNSDDIESLFRSQLNFDDISDITDDSEDSENRNIELYDDCQDNNISELLRFCT